MSRIAALLAFAAPVLAAPVPAVKIADDPVPKSAARLLAHRQVQKALKLSGDQRIAIVDGLADIDEEMEKKRDKLLKMPNVTPDVFDKLETETREKHEKFLIGAAARQLTPDLRNRLKQIDRQIRGPEAFSDPAVQKLLALTDAQKKAIEKAAKEREEKIVTYVNQGGNDDADNAKEELLKCRTEQMKTLTASLSAEQRVIWNSLLGEPVKGVEPVELWLLLVVLEEPITPN